ncbi:hypothetical protein Tco_0194478 [Tanacetum coccineum]
MNPRRKVDCRGVFDPKVVQQGMKGDFDSLHCDKSRTFDYPYYYEDIEIDKYYELPPLHPCFQPPQPHTKYDYESPNEDDEVDIDSIENVIDDLKKIDDVGSVTFNRDEFDVYMMKQYPSKPLHTDENSSIEDLLDDLLKFSLGNVNISLFESFVYIYQEQPKLKKEKGVDRYGNSNKKEKKRLDQPLTTQAIHVTSPDDDYVAPATIHIL